MFINISILNFFLWVMFGLLAGFIGHLFNYGTVKGGVIASLLLGVFGAVAGGTLANFIYGFGLHGFDLLSLLMAVTSSLAFLVVYYLTLHDKERVIK